MKKAMNACVCLIILLQTSDFYGMVHDRSLIKYLSELIEYDQAEQLKKFLATYPQPSDTIDLSLGDPVLIALLKFARKNNATETANMLHDHVNHLTARTTEQEKKLMKIKKLYAIDTNAYKK